CSCCCGRCSDPCRGCDGRGRGRRTRCLLSRLRLRCYERLARSAASRQVRSERMGLPNEPENKVTTESTLPKAAADGGAAAGAGVDGVAAPDLVLKGNPITRFFRSHPVGFWFIFWGEFAERCSFYGMRAILARYMAEQLKLGEANATIFTSVFLAACYF